jgi:hypothetical protein
MKSEKKRSQKSFFQPTDQDVTLSEKELIAIAAMIQTTLGGGGYGHAGTIMNQQNTFSQWVEQLSLHQQT